jgi:hypothetical protein
MFVSLEARNVAVHLRVDNKGFAALDAGDGRGRYVLIVSLEPLGRERHWSDDGLCHGFGSFGL